MNISIPGLNEIMAIVKEMPNKFDTLDERLAVMIGLLEETNEILRGMNEQS